jgi:hypothetical protein
MKQWLAGAGVLALCVACCAFPFLFVGVAGIVGMGVGSWVLGGILLLASLGMFMYSRNHKKHVCSVGCGCNPKTQ